MNNFNPKYQFLTVTALLFLLISNCDLLVGGNRGGQDEEEFIGACPASLFDTINERGFVRIMFDLIMEDYVPESELDEEEIKKQREAIAALQDEFLDTMKDMNISVRRKGWTRPWLSMRVEDEQALNFICRHEKVKAVQELIPETTY